MSNRSSSESGTENLPEKFEENLKIRKGDTRSRKRHTSGSDNDPQKLSRSNSEEDVVASRLREMKTVISTRSKIMDLPQAPEHGKLGRSVKLSVNCFRVHCKTEKISLYSIHFDPEIVEDSTVRKQSLINKVYGKFQEKFGLFIFENMRIWSMRKLTDKITMNVENYTLTIEYIKSVDLRQAPFEEFNQIIHIIFQRATSKSNLIKIGRNYYDKNVLDEDRFLLKQDNIRLFRGYSMNIDQTANGLHLTVDISHRVISTLSVADLIDSWDKNLAIEQQNKKNTPSSELGRGSSGSSRGSGAVIHRDGHGTGKPYDNIPRHNSDFIKKKAEEEIRGRSVITVYRMRNWRIDYIDWNINIDSTFEWRKKTGETKMISYRDYFYEVYRLQLTNERYGMLVNKPKVNNKRNQRKKGPDMFVLPPEACYLTGISPKMKSDFNLMKRIRDVVSLKPEQRFDGIASITKMLSVVLDPGERHASSTSSSRSGSSSSSEVVKDNLQIAIEDRPLQFEGRQLGEVSLTVSSFDQRSKDYRNQSIRAGDLMRTWQRAGYVKKNPHTVERWVVFHETRTERESVTLINELLRTALPYKMLKRPIDNICLKVDPRSRTVFGTWKDAISQAIAKIKNLQLIVVLLPTHFKADEVYSAVKTASLINNTRLIPTQCIKAQRFDNRKSRALGSIISSTLKQVLTKMGNVPWIVNFDIKGKFNPMNKTTMLCGIDVNHDVKRNRATAGICVSGDSGFSRYDTYVSIGPVGKENIQGAEKCMVKSILGFYSDNGVLPQHIVVYRDGVSNSELVTILKTEVKSIRNAFKHKEVIKRAKGVTYSPKLTFLVVQKRVSLRIFNARKQSADPGTVVDNCIVSSRFWDFYMLTTRPPPGKTSRPTRYIVIYDDYGMTNDDLQAFTNQLCHTYYNFPGPIRVPSPCQIAHQIAHLFGTVIADVEESLLYTPKCKGKAYYL